MVIRQGFFSGKYHHCFETSAGCVLEDVDLDRRAAIDQHQRRDGQVRHDYAGTATARETGFSTIGILISPEKMPSRIDSHHTGS